MIGWCNVRRSARHLHVGYLIAAILLAAILFVASLLAFPGHGQSIGTILALVALIAGGVVEFVANWRQAFDRPPQTFKQPNSDLLRAWKRTEKRIKEEAAATDLIPLETTTLHSTLVGRFNLEEIQTACFWLHVDYDSLEGEGKEAKARELITYLERRNRLKDLTQYIRQNRPDIKLD